jgi:demethylmenaquinone methyltransferase/2-methoxy-6-polyprenyl-1,4-benzoquinol methylase
MNEQDPRKVRELFSGIARRYDLTNRVLSAALDRGWRERVAQKVMEFSPAKILDLATGTGDLAVVLKEKIPGAAVIGADFCVPMMQGAQRKGWRKLVAADGLALPFADCAFDAVTVAFGLRNMADWPGAIREASRVLAPGGVYAVLDFSVPEGWLRPFYRIYLHRILPLLAHPLTGRGGAYEYLGRSIESFPCGKEMIELLRANGFESAERTPMACGIVSLYLARKKKK